MDILKFKYQLEEKRDRESFYINALVLQSLQRVIYICIYTYTLKHNSKQFLVKKTKFNINQLGRCELFMKKQKKIQEQAQVTSELKQFSLLGFQ